MWNTLARFLGVGLAGFLVLQADGAFAQRDRDRGDRGFELIGSERIGREVERYVIDIGRRQGRFERLRIDVEDEDALIFDLSVIYGNGERENFRVREIIREGERTQPIALKGGRVIDRIEFVGRTARDSRERATINILGEPQRGRPDDGWQLLGSSRIRFGLERTRIDLGRERGRLEQLRFEAKGEDIFVRDLRIVYGNGQSEQIRARERIRRGERSRAYKLRGDRFVERIEVVSHALGGGFGRRAVLEVYGEGARSGGGRPEARWEELGCQRVGFLVDRDIIRVGRNEGRFSALRLDVSDNKIFIEQFRVIYGNGTSDEFRVREEIRPGGQTRPIDLRGERRVIRQIEMVYRSQPNFRGQARVCVSGRQ